MKIDKGPTFGTVQGVGTEYLKIIETGQIVRWKSLGQDQVYEVETPSGIISKIHASKISKEVTPEEEANFLCSQNKKSN